MLVTLLTVITLVFGLVRLAPGGPFDGERQMPPDIEANLRAAYHLDEPIYQQYARYMSGLLQGDLGPSFRQKDFDVNELIAAGLPISAGLGVAALFTALILGIGIGIAAGFNQRTFADRLIMAVNNLNIALPTIVVAPLMVLVFSVLLRWFPAGGSDSIWHFVLPTIALALPYSAAIARLTRAGIIETKLEPHVKTAMAKGLSQSRLVYRHILPMALLPVISFLGPAAATLLTGSVVVEQVFDLPGIGRYFVQGALNRDYTLVMGVVVVYSAAIVTFNFFVDLAYAWLDPRIRLRQ
jgi:oligopeptide transport system permease protein